MHFLFGNALIYAFVRVVAPQTLVVAISVSSLWTIFLWNHPWAWLVWICEAIFVAFYARRSSPVRSDVIFWLVLGAPLLFVTCGAFLQMDMLSLVLVILKHAANGILNIVLGEIFYVALIAANPLSKFGHWPKLRTESAVITLLMAVILIPTTAYLALDVPSREKAARQYVGRGLEYQLRVSDVALKSWIESRSAVLRVYAEQQIEGTAGANSRIMDNLLHEFAEIRINSQGQSSKSSGAGDAMPLVNRVPSQNAVLAQPRLRVVASPQGRNQPSQFGLIVPFNTNGEAGVIVAQLRADVLTDLIIGQRQSQDHGVFLVGPQQEILTLSPGQASSLAQLKQLPNATRIASLRAPVLMNKVIYGQAVMANVGMAQVLRSNMMADLPGWQVITVAPLAPAVAKARQVQLRQFFALIIFVLLITVAASKLSRSVSLTFRRLSQSAYDIAASGAPRDPVGDAVIEEVNEISGKIARAGTRMGLERGALMSAQRRLYNIAQQAPVIVYALDVMADGQGNLVYVSDSLEKIMGYTPADTATPGWWIQVIHPDDILLRNEAFGVLSPDKAVNVEYRVRHKSGHYVWVWDSMRVEANPHTGKLEGNGVIMDISQRKTAAEQLLQADKMASLGRMISGTAHELNQPLNFIKMAASNLRENTLRGQMDADRFMPKLENVLAQVERASPILLQMRVFGRTPKESAHPFDVNSAVDAVVTMVAPQFELDGTQVSVEKHGGPLHVIALPMLLEQVLLNLLLNANDAIRSRQRGAEVSKGKIVIGLERCDHQAIITVTDNGTGIRPDVLRQIFDPFFTTKPAKEGTGLGLSISYGIISDLGGVIRASSNRNGACFTIELPLAGAVVN
ncbi:ATP-binding protein [Sphingorhabdus sp.]|uniref:ATP-binding protein n=1 Tax=Sphingorhabdus sp. TaxID=1902408 RepID=UPI003982EDA4